jgi:hypothetical protein
LKRGTAIATCIWTFIPIQAKPAKAFENALRRFFGIASAIGILDAEDKGPSGFASKKPVKQSSAGTSNMEVACRRWSKTNTSHKIKK